MKSVSTSLIILLAAAFMAACENEGPMEELGADADEAIEEIEQSVDDACEEIKDSVDAADGNC